MAPIVGRPSGASRDGAIAQLGERVVRNDEVRSSILLSSTNGFNELREDFLGFVPHEVTPR